MKLHNPINSLRTGWFLGTRQLRRSGKGTSVLIVFVMMLTFLNLTVVSGILIGLIEGSSQIFRARYSSDLIVSNLPDRAYINRSSDILATLNSLPETEAVSARYIAGATLTANYQQSRKPGEEPNIVRTELVGIDASAENDVTGLSELVSDGEYLDLNTDGEIMLGSYLMGDTLNIVSPGEKKLQGVEVGTKLKMTVGDKVREVTIHGIVDSKIDEVNRRIFMSDREVRNLLGRSDYNVGEIVVRLQPGADPYATKAKLIAAGYDEYATIETWQEAQGSFFDDIRVTFQVLGDLIGAIAVAVAAVTVFIVVFISAMNRRQQIGVLKGIGISSNALVFSYVIQALTYAALGAGLGLLLLFALIKPYFDANPIDFPFSDGILSVTNAGAAARAAILLLVASVAGCLPTRMIVRRNTLDTILGRN